MLKKWLLSLLAIYLSASVALSQSYVPLTEAEQREVLFRLLELETLKAKIDLLEAYIEQDETQDQEERRQVEKELDLLRRERTLLERELDLERRQKEFYKEAYETLEDKGICWKRMIPPFIWGCE